MTAQPPEGGYPYEPVEVKWIRPSVDKQLLKACTARSDGWGLLYSLGSLGLLAATGTWAWFMYQGGHWGWLALALYIHGGLHAFQPQTHEFSHGTVFRSRWLNSLFKRVFGLVYWTSNGALYHMSHGHHHRFTLHRRSEGEEVHPRPETTEQLLQTAVRVVDVTGLLLTVYDRVYSLGTPFLRNSRRGIWQRYAYANSPRREQRDARLTEAYQFLFHVFFAAWAIASGHWFLVVVVSLPGFYGGKWYAQLVHDTMHVGRQPEVDDFRLCCRSVKLDPITSFLYWHMEYHTEHHTYAGVPCYRLPAFRAQTADWWEKRQSLVEAWREMNRHSAALLRLAS